MVEFTADSQPRNSIMSLITFQAGLRSVLGSPEKHNTLRIYKDRDGNYLLSVQETGGDFGNAKSGSVRIENGQGDMQQAETYILIQNLVTHIHNMRRKYPQHPAYVVVE